MSDTTQGGGSQAGVENQERRTWLASVLMGVGLLAAYGTLAGQAFAFLLPSSTRRTRRIFVGPVSSFPIDGVRTIQDLRGKTSPPD